MLYVLGACQLFRTSLARDRRTVRRPHLPGLGRRRLVHPDPGRRRRDRLLPGGDGDPHLPAARRRKQPVSRAALRMLAAHAALPVEVPAPAPRARRTRQELDRARAQRSPSAEVSVVVVAWRARDDVLRCLASLRERRRAAARGDRRRRRVGGRHARGGPRALPRAPGRWPSRSNEGLVAGRNDALPARARPARADARLRHRGPARRGRGARRRCSTGEPEVGLVGAEAGRPRRELQLSCRRYPPLLIPFMRRGPYARLNPDPAAHRRHLMKDFDHASERPVVWVSGAAQMWRADLPRPDRALRRARLLLRRRGPRLVPARLGRRARGALRARAEIVHDWQQVTRRNLYGRKSFRALRDWYYLQWKHRRLRRDPRLGRRTPDG